MNAQLLPFWMRLHVANLPRGNFRIWLPLFLLWPLWLIALGLFFVTVVIATVVTGSFAFSNALAATRELHCFAAALRGATCELEAKGGKHLSLTFL
jgi:hypothetical protein